MSFGILIVMSFSSYGVMLALAMKFVGWLLAYTVAVGMTGFQVVGSIGMLKSAKVNNNMALLIVALRMAGVLFMIIMNALM